MRAGAGPRPRAALHDGQGGTIEELPVVFLNSVSGADRDQQTTHRGFNRARRPPTPYDNTLHPGM